MRAAALEKESRFLLTPPGKFSIIEGTRGIRLMDTDKRNNFGQAMYDMFGVGKETGGSHPAADGADASDFFLQPAGGAGAIGESEGGSFEDFRVEKAVPVRSYQGTYLAAGTMMQGTLTARGDVEIAGDFEGEIIAKGKVTLHSNITSRITATGLSLVSCVLTGNAEVSGDVNVDEQSTITGNVKAENLVCSGKITGDLDIQDNLVLDEQAQVDGNIKVDTMSMASGAKITGSIEMRNLKK